MAKKIAGYIKLQVPAGKANPSPPVGPALGQHGVNIMAFCKEFNARTQEQAGLKIPVVITVFQDKSFSFITKSPPASILLKKAAGLKYEGKPGTGANEPGKQVVASVTKSQVAEIVEAKKKDLNCYDVEAGIKIISGTARSMGITVTDG